MSFKKVAMSTLNTKLEDINNGSHNSDRLSSLPDALLVTVLSFLPLNSAAATSVLSRRWQKIWTQLTHISFPPPRKPSFKKFDYFVATFDHILSQLTSPKIHTFNLDLLFNEVGQLPETPQHFSILIPRIHIICDRNPEAIMVRCHSFGSFYLPTCIFETQSLIDLKLQGNLNFKFPCGYIFNFDLPNLKKLHLITSYTPTLVLLLLKSLSVSFPLLEDLSLLLKLTDKDYSIEISSPNLKRLYVEMLSVSKNTKCVIDAPKLEYFKMLGMLGFYDFVTSPIHLQEVEISLYFYFDCIYDDFSHVKRLILGISGVRSLSIRNLGVLLLSYLCDLDDTILPVFPNLVHLCLGNVDEYLGRKLPRCLLGKLKSLKASQLGCNDYEIELLRYTLSNASVLEELDISGRADDVHQEFAFCRKLFMLLKTSPSLHIVFSGRHIKTSSKDFKDGVLGLLVKL